MQIHHFVRNWISF